MFTNKKRLVIPVFSVVLVTLMALMSVVPALAATATKDRTLSPAELGPAPEPPKKLPIIPVPPTDFMHVAKLDYRELPWTSPTHRQIAISVAIADASGKGEPGAEVTGLLDISSADLVPFVGLTDRNGVVVFNALIPHNAEGKFCVEDVAKKDFEYVPAKNFATCIEILPGLSPIGPEIE